ncbi:hypothetical protein [Vibrio mediterranei]|uniref:hypothetical protein n=1 Tax=Vibrio mediterranei TaxID=689 RepID=UPI0040690D3A
MPKSEDYLLFLLAPETGRAGVIGHGKKETIICLMLRLHQQGEDVWVRRPDGKDITPADFPDH